MGISIQIMQLRLLIRITFHRENGLHRMRL